jgi:hypothetical protein
VVIVHYGTSERGLLVEPGLHSGYVSVTGSTGSITVDGLGGAGMCIGDAEAGNLRPSPAGQVLPPK